MENSDTFRSSVPANFNLPEITAEQVKSLAYKNHPITHTVNRRIMEAQMRIDAARADRGFRADVLLYRLGQPEALRHYRAHTEGCKIVRWLR
jgi:hypothetical protein